MKKKYSLTALAALGMISCFAQEEATNVQIEEPVVQTVANSSCPSAKQEKWLFGQVNSESKRLYNSMDCEGKSLAMRMAEQTCAGQNECAGLNSCKSEANSCAGKGSCEGQSQGPFDDKNKAVQLAAKKMAKKRTNTYKNNNNSNGKGNCH